LLTFKISLANKRGSCELVTVGSDATPHPECRAVPPVDLNVTWLLAAITDANASKFAIDRQHAKCNTPRRNPQVNAAMEYFYRCHNWASEVWDLSFFLRMALTCRLRIILCTQFSQLALAMNENDLTLATSMSILYLSQLFLYLNRRRRKRLSKCMLYLNVLFI
jgi:hypothetical protein